MRLRILFSLLALTLVEVSPAEWNRFRGPDGSGVSADGTPPVEIGDQNFAWKVPVPPGLSAPSVLGDRVVLTALEDGRLVTLAFEKKTGKLAWRKLAPEVPLEKVHETSSPATPTPHLDGSHVFVYFGSYGLICYSASDGEEIWKKPLPTPKSLYGMATSPIGYGDNIILVLDNDENLPDSKLSKSKIVAFKKSDGELAWETPRPFNRSGWSVPTIWRQTGEIVVLGNGRVTGYDAGSGEEKWFATGFSRETIAAPFAGGGRMFASASMLGGNGDEKTDPEPFWEAVMKFDGNGDGRLQRDEMTGKFTFPLRPELPIGHPGFGIPLPSLPEKRRPRLDSMFGWVDKDRDGFWTEEEFVKNMVGGRGKPLLMAIRPGGSGNISETHIDWRSHQGIPEIPSPLYFEVRLYLVRKGGIFTAIDAESGDVVYRERIPDAPGQYSASPIMANGHLYLASNLGKISVTKAGDEFEVVHQHDLGEPIFVTPAIDGKTIYIRGEKHLWAFRRPRER